MTLTFNLDQDMMVLDVYAEFKVRRLNSSPCRAQTDRHTQTHMHMDTAENITYSANMGGNNEDIM